MIALSKKSSCSSQLCLALCAFGLALLGDVSRAVPMDDQDYYLQEISNRDHYYSFPYPGEEFFPFTEQPGEEGPVRAAETEEHPGFKPSKKALKPKKSNKKGKSILETPPGRAQEALGWVRISQDQVSEEESVREEEKSIKWPMQATMKIILRKEFECIKIG
ncbi:inactive carboxypeptidase-like protein x2 [Limosa lapponica baueri]|uniref:Inactive carboxypeptidase-like protein x2 n=1 Tax=Limosa lapponica baueri TaxID=1758121 RepID=A0A2I0T5U7_LIMLA|nr:inactive carboxypeptidase-like protein x2 [Limosa lapponica baueri]